VLSSIVCGPFVAPRPSASAVAEVQSRLLAADAAVAGDPLVQSARSACAATARLVSDAGSAPRALRAKLRASAQAAQREAKAELEAATSLARAAHGCQAAQDEARSLRRSRARALLVQGVASAAWLLCGAAAALTAGKGRPGRLTSVAVAVAATHCPPPAVHGLAQQAMAAAAHAAATSAASAAPLRPTRDQWRDTLAASQAAVPLGAGVSWRRT